MVPSFVRQRFSKSSKAISKGTSKFFKRLGQGFDKWADRYLPAPLVKSIRAVTRTVRRTRKGATKFATSWLKSRDYVKLAWSLPAAMMLLPVFTTLTLAFAHTDADKITHYQLAESEANIEGKIELVHLFRRRLEQLGFHREESSEYEEALRAAKTSGFEMAYKRMKLLAPLPLEANSASDANDDSTVFVEPKSLYPPAHLWIAGALMQGNVSIGTAEENWKRAHDHVQHVLSHNANDPTAQFYEIKIAEHEGKSFI